MYERPFPKEGGEIPLYVTLIAFKRQYLDYLYCDTALVIEKELKSVFHLPDNFKYYAFNASEDINISGYPMFLFFNPDDLKEAEDKGYIDKMTDVAYNIILQRDVLHLLPPREHFKPQVFSRRDLSSKLLSCIDGIREAGFNGSFMPF